MDSNYHQTYQQRHKKKYNENVIKDKTTAKHTRYRVGSLHEDNEKTLSDTMNKQLLI